MDAKEWRSKTAAIAVAVLFATRIAVGAYLVATPENIASYYVWRLHKDNGTDSDHFRAKEKLLGYLGNSPTPYRELTRLLTVPNLRARTADNVLALLLQSRQLAAAKAVDIQGLLVESLHTDNSDIRARIQKVLSLSGQGEGHSSPAEFAGRAVLSKGYRHQRRSDHSPMEASEVGPDRPDFLMADLIIPKLHPRCLNSNGAHCPGPAASSVQPPREMLE